MASRVRVTIHQANMRWFLTSPGGPIVRYVNTHTRRILNAQRATAPVDTGVGRAGMRSDVVVQSGTVRGRIFMPQHLWYQALGTGIYGPRGQPIRPVRAQFLVWEGKGGGGGPGRNLIFARQVRGVPRNDWMIRAMEATSPWPVNQLR